MRSGLGNVMEKQKAVIHSLFYLLLQHGFCLSHGPSRQSDWLVLVKQRPGKWKKTSQLKRRKKKNNLDCRQEVLEQRKNAGLWGNLNQMQTWNWSSSVSQHSKRTLKLHARKVQSFLYNTLYFIPNLPEKKPSCLLCVVPPSPPFGLHLYLPETNCMQAD